MDLQYFYQSQANQFSFIQIPKILVIGEAFSQLQLSAKILYGILLDRMKMAHKNNWIDEEGKVYIIYQVSDIEEDMNISKRKIIECLNELECLGLIQKKRQGMGLPNQIYVMNFVPNAE